MTNLSSFLGMLRLSFKDYHTEFYPEHDIFSAENPNRKNKFVFASFQNKIVVDCYARAGSSDSEIHPGLHWSEPVQYVFNGDEFTRKTIRDLERKFKMETLF